MNDSPTEQHRRTCEARHWLRQGYVTVDQVDDLIDRIAKKRGQEAADQLRQDMRQQWRIRREWMDQQG